MITGIENSRNTRDDHTNSTVKFYATAKEEVIGLGFRHELCWQSSLEPEAFSETDLLREAAWVILCSGFREAVVRRVFGYISLCFCDWESADVIGEYQEYCRAAALRRFGNRKKIDAIIRVAEMVRQEGFDRLKAYVLANPVKTLQTFPFLGPVTALHLAKNLGFPVAKPDRHLQRLASGKGYKSADHLCHDIALATGDSIQLVDLVLWRYCERINSHPRH